MVHPAERSIDATGSHPSATLLRDGTLRVMEMLLGDKKL
jgi:hypothetical protein